MLLDLSLSCLEAKAKQTQFLNHYVNMAFSSRTRQDYESCATIVVVVEKATIL